MATLALKECQITAPLSHRPGNFKTTIPRMSTEFFRINQLSGRARLTKLHGDRTSELRKKGYAARRLGPKQMTTDTAVRVTRIVTQDKGMITQQL